MLGRRQKLFAIECFGVRLQIAVSHAALLETIESVLPPGSSRCSSGDVDGAFSLERVVLRGADSYRVSHDDEELVATDRVSAALDVLDSAMRASIALRAPDHVFVHAGAVEHRGRAIVIPGETFSGKSTLVAALVRRGAAYMSDEFAVLDGEGRVLPYPRPLSMRSTEAPHTATDVSHDELGGRLGGPARLGLIVSTRYRPGAAWNPQTVSTGTGALMLMANTVPARERPEQCLAAIARATATASVVDSDRGEADDVATWLLECDLGM